jgi:TetR/AcrR family transcriptional regulator, fatty acid metabolism regulator protein
MAQNRSGNDVKKEKESAIIDAACQVIRAKGFHQARITDIAQAAGISYGLVYHYFKSKADLFDAILKEWWTGLFSTMEQFQNRGVSPEEELDAIVGYFLDQYEKRPDLVHIVITEISRSSVNLTPDRLAVFKDFIGRTEKIVARGQGARVFRSDIRARYLTFIFLGALESFVSILVLEGRPIKGRGERQRIAVALQEVFLNGAKAVDPPTRQ